MMSDEFTNGTEGEVVTQAAISEKSKSTAALLCFFLGGLGIHRFYLGKAGSGIAMLLLNLFGWATVAFVIGIPFAIAVGIWWLVDFIMILSGNLKDKDGRKLR